MIMLRVIEVLQDHRVNRSDLVVDLTNELFRERQHSSIVESDLDAAELELEAQDQRIADLERKVKFLEECLAYKNKPSR